MNATAYQIAGEVEALLPLGELPAAMERLGVRRPHACTVRRWRTRGVHGIRLPVVLLEQRLCTSVEAVRWWIAATSAAAQGAQ